MLINGPVGSEISFKKKSRVPRDIYEFFCDKQISYSDEEVNFYLFTNNNGNLSKQIKFNGTHHNLTEAILNPINPTKVIVHGENSNMNLYPLIDMRSNYLNKSDSHYNVIAVDWGKFATGCFLRALQSAKKVGYRLAQLIQDLVHYGAEDIHVIGFSLGAHIPAFAANSLKPYKIPRITGLDPALLYLDFEMDDKLDAGDAEFVDVYHTDIFHQGKKDQCGHADFYMNGGKNQPGCISESKHSCNHLRAAIYFAESINSEIGFWGYSCFSYSAYIFGRCKSIPPTVLSGDRVFKNASGFYIVVTNAQKPFAKGHLL